jgi:hypothetical protein
MKSEAINRTCSVDGGNEKFVFGIRKENIMFMEVIIAFYKSQQQFCNKC